MIRVIINFTGRNIPVAGLKCRSVVFNFIKEGVRIKLRDVLHYIKPFLPVFKLTINDGGVPVYISSEDDMWQFIPFCNSTWLDG